MAKSEQRRRFPLARSWTGSSPPGQAALRQAKGWTPRAAHRATTNSALKLRLIKESFSEVLDATKHQDEKIGRFLTAIAFLTTGGITLLFRGDLIAARFEVGATRWPGGGSYPFLAWSTLAFFACILTSVMLLLISLSTPLQLQQRKKPRSDLTGSRLFFGYIGRETRADWAERWHGPSASEIEAELFKQYISETHNLSERAKLKYAHTDEAAALFIFSLLFLGTAVVLAVDVGLASSSGSTAGLRVSGVAITEALRFVLGSIFAGHAFTQLYAAHNKEQQSVQSAGDSTAGQRAEGEPLEKPDKRRVVRTLRLIIVLAPLWTFSVILPSETIVYRWVGAVTAAALGIVLLVWLLKISNSMKTRCTRGALMLVLTAVGPVALYFDGIWPICIAALPALAISAQVTTRGFFREQEIERGSHRGRISRSRDQTELAGVPAKGRVSPR